jgi:hypothetical protein
MFGGGAVVKQGGGAQVLTLSWTAARKPSGAQTAAKGGMIKGQHATFTIQTSHVKLNPFRSNITRHSDRSPPLSCDRQTSPPINAHPKMDLGIHQFGYVCLPGSTRILVRTYLF